MKPHTETAETEYWLRLLVMYECITEAEGDAQYREAASLSKI